MHDEITGISEETIESREIPLSLYPLFYSQAFFRNFLNLLSMKLQCLFLFYILICPKYFYSQCDCKSLSAPTKSITVKTVAELRDALNQANANNGNMYIFLQKGTYTLTNNLPYIGPNAKNLTIRGEGNNRDQVIIRGQGMNGNVSHIFNVAASNFTLADMTIGWVFYHPIQIHGESNADSSLIHNVKIIDGNEQFIKISGSANEVHASDGGIIECCHFEFSAGIGNQYYTGGVDGHHCNNWIVRNNVFKHIKSPDSNLAEHAVHFWSNSRDIITENNWIINCDRGIGYGLSDDPSRGNSYGIIRNNFIHTSRDVGIGIERSPGVKVYNNTVWTDNYTNSIEYRFAGTIQTHIANNLTNKNIRQRDNAQATLENNVTNAQESWFANTLVYDYHLSGKNDLIIGKGKNLAESMVDFDCMTRGISNDIGADQVESVTKSVSSQINDSDIRYNSITEMLEITIENSIPLPAKLELTNYQGQLIMIKKIVEYSTQFSSRSLAPGIYYITLHLNTAHPKNKPFIVVR